MDPLPPTNAGASTPISAFIKKKEERAKFIRTFEADMAALKAGSAPDLQPYHPSAAPKPAAPVPAKPATPAPPPMPSFFPPTDELLRMGGHAPGERAEPANPEARLIEGSTLPEPVITVAAPPPPPPPPPAPTGPTPIHTYSEDFTNRVRSTGASQATVLAAEQDRGTRKTAPRERTKNIGLYVVGLVLVLVAAGGLYYAFAYFEQGKVPVIITPVAVAPIFVDEQAEIQGSGPALAQTIAQSAGQSLQGGHVRFLYFSPSASSTESVFNALGLPAPGGLLRNITADGSMAGIVSAGGTEAPFFILAVSSYGETFAGMLAWEPNMAGDLAIFYPPSAPLVATATASTTGATASSTPVVPVHAPGFFDQVIDNHDARVDYDASGHPLLVYGYWDQQTLLIARDPAAFSELITRLATSRKQ